MSSAPELDRAVERVLARLKTALAANLHSCVLYGSLVRGNAVEGVSDVNLLIVLEEPTPEAHAAIADAVRDPVRVEPMIVGRRGLVRTERCFGLKFRSIARNYRVLAGQDPLAGLKVDEAHLRFLSEQGLRNAKMRLVHAFVVFGAHDPKRFTRYVIDTTPGWFVDLCEPLRAFGQELSPDLDARVAAIEKGYEVDAGVLRDLLRLRAAPRDLGRDEAKALHGRIWRLLEAATRLLETRWPSSAS